MAEIVQVIDGEGHFEQDLVQQFVSDNGLPDCKTNYQVVAIMGPQSSGKSTLLNYVFGTSFTMMDAMAGRGQTTKGIWMSKSPKITDTTVLVMDLEGSDGRERGEDDTNFERQSALFALAVADVLLVNVWCHDIGREHGSGKPLLRTIFQVNLKLFAPEPDRKKSVLLFVIRDKTKTPLPKLVEVLGADLDRMWDSIAKPKAYEESKISDFFEVQYAALSHFEERYEDFQADAVHLRRRFSPDGDETLIRGDEKLPGDSFALSIHNIWEVIRSQKDLNLPAHKVMVANVRCQQILEDQLRAFREDQAWGALKEESTGGIVEGCGARAHSLMDSCVKGYLAEALYFDAHVREGKLADLQQQLLAAIQPVYQTQVAAHQAAVMAVFEKDLKLALVEAASGKDQAAGGFVAAAAACRAEAVRSFAAAYVKHVRIPDTPWDGVAEDQALAEALDGHITRVRGEQITAATARVEKKLAAHISMPVIDLLEVCAPGMWPRLYTVCRNAATSAGRDLKQQLSGFGLREEEAQALSQHLERKATSNMENHVREAALTRLSRMKDRFHDVFSRDAETKAPRLWRSRENIPAIAQQARTAAANVLSQLAVIRPAAESSSQEQGGDVVESAVLQLSRSASTIGSGGAEADSTASTSSDSHPAVDILSAAAWPGVDEGRVLITPHEVRTTWREFVSSSNDQIQQAQATQQANQLANNRMPPLWALGMMLVLGWNEAMALLWNPLYLLLAVLVFLFLRSLYTELDIEREMAAGALPGALRLSQKFLPACQSVIRKTQDVMHRLLPEAQHEPQNSSARQAPYTMHPGTPGRERVTELTRRPAAGAPDAPHFTDLQAECKKDQ